MCLLSDNELRLCGQKNTNDLPLRLLERFISHHPHFVNVPTSSTSVSFSPYNTKHHHTIQFQRYHFDRLMLTLALQISHLFHLDHPPHWFNPTLPIKSSSVWITHSIVGINPWLQQPLSCCSHTGTTQEIFTVSESDGEDEKHTEISQ